MLISVLLVSDLSKVFGALNKGLLGAGVGGGSEGILGAEEFIGESCVTGGGLGKDGPGGLGEDGPGGLGEEDCR